MEKKKNNSNKKRSLPKKEINKKSSKKPIIFLLITLIILVIIIGISYAAFFYDFEGETNLITKDEVSIEFLESNDVIEVTNALPMSDKQGILQEVTFDFSVTTRAKKEMDFIYSLYIEKLEVDSGYSPLNDEDIKIYLSDYNEIGLIAPVKISDLENEYIFYTGINKHSSTITEQKDMFKLRAWINHETDISDWNSETKLQYKFKIGLKSHENTENIDITLSNYIDSLYTFAEKESVVNNGVAYSYARDHNMMNDNQGGTTTDSKKGNIRYYGDDPDNYVYFNCTDYDQPSESTCEVWRILGLFKDVQENGANHARIKLIRGDVLGNYSFDTSISTLNGGNGVHAWEKADLMYLLNPSYTDTFSINNSLYWNRSSGKCYTGKNNASSNCDFSTTGLTEDTRNMISTSTYHLGTFTEEDYNQMMSGDYANFMKKFYAHLMYNYERSDTVYDCDVDDGACPRAKTWTGKVALMYPSDYIYATDLSLCSHDGISFGWADWNHSNLETDACYTNDWLSFASGIEWLITPHYEPRYRSWTLSAKYVFGAYDYRNYRVRPVLYLNENVKVIDGDGSSQRPYILK